MAHQIQVVSFGTLDIVTEDRVENLGGHRSVQSASKCLHSGAVIRRMLSLFVIEPEGDLLNIGGRGEGYRDYRSS